MNKQKKIYSTDEIKSIAASVFANNDFVNEAHLFGSYARSEQTENSDFDCMIVLSYPTGLEYFGLYELL